MKYEQYKILTNEQKEKYLFYNDKANIALYSELFFAGFALISVYQQYYFAALLFGTFAIFLYVNLVINSKKAEQAGN